MKKISIFGSTGSIGKKTIAVILENLSEYQVEVLTANTNVKLLAEQASLVKAKRVVISDNNLYQELKNLLMNVNVDVSSGHEQLKQVAKIRVDYAMVAIVGIAALIPVMELIKTGIKVIALANKESIVCAGHLLLSSAVENGVHIIPVDSEHNAIFQIFHHKEFIEKVTLTASGGPFLFTDYENMKCIKLQDALNHPVWQMGQKISVDSATMMNKALEIIEAYYFFSINPSQIDIVIHPESIIHGLVSYVDGCCLAVMSVPDMSIPINYTISWPCRMNSKYCKKLNLFEQEKLTFLRPDYEKFPALKLGFDVLRSSQVSVNSIILNAANEVAVQAFLQSKIIFTDIVSIVSRALDRLSFDSVSTLDSVIECNKIVRKFTNDVISNELHCL